MWIAILRVPDEQKLGHRRRLPALDLQLSTAGSFVPPPTATATVRRLGAVQERGREALRRITTTCAGSRTLCFVPPSMVWLVV
uniref:Uncharacterized protein n=1 Tax=Setaria italica TaxID=4555 RepID=K3YFF3_SETIT